MTDTEVIKLAIAQAAIEAAKARVLMISGEGERQNMNTECSGKTKVTRNGTELSLYNLFSSGVKKTSL